MENLGKKPTRTCLDCKLCSDELNLYVSNKGSKYGKRNLCVSCAVIRNNKQPKQKDWKTDHQTKKRYGVDVATYKQRMQTQQNCEICGSIKELCYDHDHNTMQFRGVLCRSCNRSLGQLGDNLSSILKVVDYLTKESKHGK